MKYVGSVEVENRTKVDVPAEPGQWVLVYKEKGRIRIVDDYNACIFCGSVATAADLVCLQCVEEVKECRRKQEKRKREKSKRKRRKQSIGTHY